jgi:hypothetical protein
MRAVLAMLLVTLPATIGCPKKAREGLPPAESWDQLQSAGAMVSLEQGQRPSTMGGRPTDPHAGVPGAPPIGGGGVDPHAGVPGAPPIGGGDVDPHAGMGGGVDVTQLGIPPPDPDRKIDPDRRVKGTIRLHPNVKGRVAPNGPVFVVIKRAGADGQPTGTALAVEKLLWSGDALAFELTEANAMQAGTELTGDVVVTARYDQDADAISKQPGDVTGQVRVKVPADKVELLLDTVLP